MEEEPKDIIVLGAIKKGAKKFDKISKTTGIEPEELNKILEKLEQRGFIRVEKKKNFLGGEKTELFVTDKGSNELEQRVHEMNQNWEKMVQLYKSGDKQKLQDYMDSNKSFLPMMMFFGIMDMMMFSMMFSMIGASMYNYVPPDQIAPGADNQPSDIGTDGGDSGSGGDMGGDGMDGGGYDIDIGF
jgi:DNA-binding HxlR family transcriptional regulator